MIHKKHFDRVKKMLTDHKGKNVPEPPTYDETDLIMNEEVFGPFWAVVKVSSIDEAVKCANNIPTGKPLVSYYYGQSEANMNTWMEQTTSGSLAINSGPMR